MVFNPNVGMPKVGAEKIARHRYVKADGYLEYLPGGAIFDGLKTRDPDNDDPLALRAGLLVGKATTGGKWANSVIGVTQAAAASGATAVTLTLAQAAELVRRVGATGTLRFVGPPTAAGTVATFTETYSAVNLGTGVVTVSALDAALVAGSFLAADDGTHVPLSFLPDGWERLVPPDGGDFPFERVPIAGNIEAAQLLPWPADASLRQWVRDSLRSKSGRFTFTEQYA